MSEILCPLCDGRAACPRCGGFGVVTAEPVHPETEQPARWLAAALLFLAIFALVLAFGLRADAACCKRLDGTCYTATACGVYGACDASKCGAIPTPTPRPTVTPTRTPGPTAVPTPAGAPKVEFRDGTWYVTLPPEALNATYTQNGRNVFINGQRVSTCAQACSLLRLPLPPCAGPVLNANNRRNP